VTERNKNKIGKEFKYLDKLFAWGNGKPIIKECKNLNIYSDVAPFKETAVVLDGGSPEKVDASNYINACYIKSSFKERGNPFGLIIATQGPQPHTCESFWKMVIENNVTKIVTLC
jgi:protein tyrosine phosphatase